MLAHRQSLTQINYERFRALICERTGINFSDRRRSSLEHAVLNACQRSQSSSIEVYFFELQSSATETPLWIDLIREVTVGETYFFRDQAQFEALRQHILPTLIARRSAERRLRLWSAGCASGEEPYSLAILLKQLIPKIDQWNVLILATDISQDGLNLARQGRYREWSFRQVDPKIREHYFSRNHSSYVLHPDIRKMVTFAYLNLADEQYPSLATNTNALDLILFRNVAIYLPEEMIRKVAERFYRCLAADGWLIVGAAEMNNLLFNRFNACQYPGTTAYCKSIPTPLNAATVYPPLPVPAGDTGLLRPAQQAPTFLTPEPCMQPETALQPPPPVSRQASETATSSQPAADRYQQGLLAVQARRYEQALEHFTACIQAAPEEAAAYHQIGRIQANRGRLDEAQAWCLKALELNPFMAETYYTLALIHQEQGATHTALEHFKKAIYLDPRHILAHFSLSTLLRQSGHISEARRHRHQAHQLASHLPGDQALPGGDGLTAEHLLAILNASK